MKIFQNNSEFPLNLIESLKFPAHPTKASPSPFSPPTLLNIKNYHNFPKKSKNTDKLFIKKILKLNIEKIQEKSTFNLNQQKMKLFPFFFHFSRFSSISRYFLGSTFFSLIFLASNSMKKNSDKIQSKIKIDRQTSSRVMLINQKSNLEKRTDGSFAK